MYPTARITALALALFGLLQTHTMATERGTAERKRIQSALTVLHELTNSPDRSIPKTLLERADAIVVIPSLVKGGFIVGAEHGRGVMSARRDGAAGWSSPAFVTMTGGTIGWQVGVESVDLVLLVMNKKGVDDLLTDRSTLGGAASVAAGPVGRTADASTDAKLSSQILAYSRTNGLFAGATFEGAALHSDKESNLAFYDRSLDLQAIVSHSAAARPSDPRVAQEWQSTLQAVTRSAPCSGCKSSQ